MPKPLFSRQLSRKEPNWVRAESELAKSLRQRGCSYEDISAALKNATGIHRSVSAVKGHLHEKRDTSATAVWPKERDDKLREMAENGESARHIADQLGTSRNAIIGRCRRIGVRLRRSGKSGGLQSAATARRKKPVRTKPRAGTLPRQNCGRLTIDSADWIASIPPAKLKTDDPVKHRHPVHIRVAAARFMEWRSCNQ